DLGPRGVAAARAAATLFVLCALLALASAACASVKVEGLDAWLSESARRSMAAVYDHIPRSESPAVKEELMRVVAERLLLGYSVGSVVFSGDEAVLTMKVSSPVPDWRVAIAPPNLSPPVDAWFAADIAGLEGEILPIIRNAPLEMLSWGDLDLKREIEGLSGKRIPGWRVLLLAQAKTDGGVVLNVSFAPEQPLTLAVTTKINSASIPAVLHSNLRDDLMKGFAPVIGVPVPWLERHKDDLAALGRSVLNDEELVQFAKANPVVAAEPGVVSDIDVELESRRYSAGFWMSVYAGAEEHYPEAGIHLGRRIQLLPHWDMEMYWDAILRLDDWELENRLGLRWPVWRNIWVGGEWSDMDDIWWGRLDFDSWARRPYAWLRYSEEHDVGAALGYHINDYISIELNYDSRYEDEVNVRALLNL
ncbi:MAG: hypothetical protein LBG12_09855, partial [Synergistaceae bacterium]|nr:hypothetical protein [Synergistaceae bacterium]